MSKTYSFALLVLVLVFVALAVTVVPASSGALLRSADPSTRLQGICPDQYEPDNDPAQAKPILPDGAAQRHTFDPVGDQDWKFFQATAGRVYTATTFNLLLDTDTTLRLYDTDGATVLAFNDDYPGSPEPLASQIVWTAPADGQFYLRTRDFYGRGDCLGYDINLIDDTTPVANFGPWLPMLLVRYAPPPTPTASATSTPTPTSDADGRPQHADDHTFADGHQHADADRADGDADCCSGTGRTERHRCQPGHQPRLRRQPEHRYAFRAGWQRSIGAG